MKNWIVALVVLAGVVVSGSVFAAAPAAKEVICVSLAAAPAMDGKVSGDKAWKNISATDGNFFVFGTEGVIARKKTYFRTGHTSDALFIAVECEETDTPSIKAVMGDGGELWTEDSVEVFIGLPGAESEYFQFIVNAAGARYNGITKNQTPAADWEVKTFTAGRMWSVEIKIPFKTLKATPKKGDKWSFNLCRNICSIDLGISTSWAQVVSSFHEPESFGKIIFK
jgi:hypothetical protein